MYIVEPVKFKNCTVVNVVNSYDKSTYSRYDSTKTYKLNDIVWDVYQTNYKNSSDNDFEVWYICISNDDIIDKKPYENQPLYWSVLTVDNNTAFLDRYIDTITLSQIDKPLIVEIQVGVVDIIHNMNITAKKIYLEYKENPDDDYKLEIIYDLKENTSIWNKGVYIDTRYQKSALFNLPYIKDNSFYRLTFTNGDISSSAGYVAVGKIITGFSRQIGITKYPIDTTLMSLSTKIKDDSGYTYFNKQGTYKNTTYEVLIDNNLRDVVYSLMQSIDAKNCLFVPKLDSVDMTIITFGNFTDFTINLQGENESEFSITVEGSL